MIYDWFELQRPIQDSTDRALWSIFINGEACPKGIFAVEPNSLPTFGARRRKLEPMETVDAWWSFFRSAMKAKRQLNTNWHSFCSTERWRGHFFMNFTFKWKHRDGSIVGFSAQGWTSDDPEKATGWLKWISLAAPREQLLQVFVFGCSSIAS